eukprot:CAMPEP_0172603642 /NCGR_PEP_ID=MMETSP1068-20121228/23897_1 /TAXON_ID=35684 /ORGANISM="Pseudopedinella elastica, Strain CCMP716" /LENGTH=670 /DNA_ID=CAMNT_0013405455 /DNA_START=16 /DNA_END=2029 /DNA_ORIENTATION=-
MGERWMKDKGKMGVARATLIEREEQQRLAKLRSVKTTLDTGKKFPNVPSKRTKQRRNEVAPLNQPDMNLYQTDIPGDKISPPKKSQQPPKHAYAMDKKKGGRSRNTRKWPILHAELSKNEADEDDDDEGLLPQPVQGTSAIEIFENMTPSLASSPYTHKPPARHPRVEARADDGSDEEVAALAQAIDLNHRLREMSGAQRSAPNQGARSALTQTRSGASDDVPRAGVRGLRQLQGINGRSESAPPIAPDPRVRANVTRKPPGASSHRGAEAPSVGEAWRGPNKSPVRVRQGYSQGHSQGERGGEGGQTCRREVARVSPIEREPRQQDSKQRRQAQPSPSRIAADNESRHTKPAKPPQPITTAESSVPRGSAPKTEQHVSVEAASDETHAHTLGKTARQGNRPKEKSLKDELAEALALLAHVEANPLGVSSFEEPVIPTRVPSRRSIRSRGAQTQDASPATSSATRQTQAAPAQTLVSTAQGAAQGEASLGKDLQRDAYNAWWRSRFKESPPKNVRANAPSSFAEGAIPRQAEGALKNAMETMRKDLESKIVQQDIQIRKLKDEMQGLSPGKASLGEEEARDEFQLEDACGSNSRATEDFKGPLDAATERMAGACPTEDSYSSEKEADEEYGEAFMAEEEPRDDQWKPSTTLSPMATVQGSPEKPELRKAG